MDEDQNQSIDILKCGICLDFLKIPKQLPCLHMFCKSCITLQVSVDYGEDGEQCDHFLCPVCRTVVPYPDEFQPSTFVKELPTKIVYEALVSRLQLKEKVIYCGLCPQEDKKQQAEAWCEDCNEGLCCQCSKVHQKIKAVRSHEIMKLEDAGFICRKFHVELYCKNHSEKKINHFCYDHQISCCSLCVTELHRKCENVTTLKNASKDVAESSMSLMQSIDDVIEKADFHLENQNDAFKKMEHKRQVINTMVSSFRSEINAHLNKLEADFQKDFDKTHKSILDEIKKETETCYNHKQIAINCKQLMSILINHSSNENVFSEMPLIKELIQEEDKTMSEIMGNLVQKQYQIELSPELVNLMESVNSICTLRTVTRSPAQQTITVSPKLSKDKHVPNKYYNSQKKNIINPEKFPSSRIHGTQLLSDGRILLTNSDNKLLVVYDSQGNPKIKIPLPGKPVDVTLVNEIEAAVSYKSPNGIAIVDINSMIIRERNILQHPDFQICGITSDGNKLVAASNDSILVMDLTGSTLREIETEYTYVYRYISFISESRLCFSNGTPASVQCIDIDGNLIFTYQHENLKGPYGITCDDEGVIYVAERSLNSVHQISPDGKFVKYLLSTEDGIENPTALNFNLTTKQLILTHSEKYIEVFQMI